LHIKLNWHISAACRLLWEEQLQRDHSIVLSVHVFRRSVSWRLTIIWSLGGYMHKLDRGVLVSGDITLGSGVPADPASGGWHVTTSGSLRR
jgi:hypothetical protein